MSIGTTSRGIRKEGAKTFTGITAEICRGSETLAVDYTGIELHRYKEEFFRRIAPDVERREVLS